MLELIGEPTERSRNYEESDKYITRLLRELQEAQQHKFEHPEDGSEVNTISQELASRLIEMRKTRTALPLRIGMYSRPTENPDEPERNLVFAYGHDLFIIPDEKNQGETPIFSLHPEDQLHTQIDQQVLITKTGELNFERVALVPSLPHLETKLKTDDNGES